MRAHTNVHNLNLHDDDGEEVTTPGPMPATPGRRLGRYVMFEEIARGEMGALHLGCAMERQAPRPVAIKHLYPWLAANSAYASTYLREARLAARIRHPNVARTTDVVTGTSSGELYLVMDYVHGDTLAHLLSQTRRLDQASPPPTIVAGVMTGLLRGLHAVQEATLAEDFPAQHAQREVSPQDVIVGLDGVTRIFEFGAINLAHGHMRELVSGRGADVFSAGAMLWEILAGRRLFGDPADRDIFFTSATNLTPPPSHFNRDVPPELDAVVLRALRKDRDRRYLSAQAFADAIEAALTPAAPREIGDWVARTSTHLLAARAVRIAGITRAASGARPESTPAPVRPHLPVERLPWSAPRVWPRATVFLALAVTAALVGVGLWARAGEVGGAATQPALLTTALIAAPAATVPAAAPAATAPGIAPAMPPPPSALPAPGAPAAAPVAAARTTVAAIPPALTMRFQRHAAAERAARPSVARIAKLNRAALRAYRRMDPATARRKLNAALTECARTGLGRHAIAARTHALMGVVLAGGFKQPELGAEQFKSALRIDPRVPVPPRYASEADVAAALRAAVAAGDLRSP